MAQARWDGGGGDGQWATAANWVGDALPLPAEEVLLDNSMVAGNYTVSLPGLTATVTIRSITISPAAGDSIQFIIPPSSTAAPAFTATGPGYGITINNGGVLLNSSGSTAGAAITVNDSIRINNGGQYTHNSRCAHALLVTVLSGLPGTERGVFKLDAPGGGYTFASTNRVYGTLVLSAAASGGSQVYATSAARPLTINGDFIIEPGVTVNLAITAATIIKGNYMQEGGVFNLASQPNNNIVSVKGNFIQTAGAITETSTGRPTIELNGSVNQNIQVAGNIINSVGFSINNNAGVTLLAGLSLPYKLNLLNGVVDTQSFLLTLLAGCSIQADSAVNNSFINGPLRKEGLQAASHFLFPAGKGSTQRWLALKNATGNYTVEFFKSSPAIVGSVTGTGIHHVSSTEYWSINADADPAPAAQVELSFDNVNSGGVTDMPALRVAQLLSGIWTDQGNTATTGIPGYAGSVTSNSLNVFEAGINYFTLASSNAFQNPLPLQLISFSGYPSGSTVILNWMMEPSWQLAGLELQSSADGIHFIALSKIDLVVNQPVYQYTDKRQLNGRQYYRLKAIEKDGSIFYSGITRVGTDGNVYKTIQIRPSVVKGNASLYFNAAAPGNVQISIISTEGREIQKIQVFLPQGNTIIPLHAGRLAAGVYIISVRGADNKVSSTRFVILPS
ncbi:MAG: hypothetical protein NVSMB7_05840 [Chitinophagaceae bacterium]